MGIVFGLITGIAGVVYIIYQYHRENPGFLPSMLMVFLVMLGPPAIYGLTLESIDFLDPMYNVVGGLMVAHWILVTVIIVWATIDPKNRIAKSESKMQIEIMNEINALPPPTEEELTAIKIANNLTLDPASKKYNDEAARKIWRQQQYNKRMKERHYGLF